MKAINAIRMGGIDVLPLVEGGKGVSISNGISSGNWAFDRRRRHVQRGQRRQLRRRGQPHPAGLSRPHPARAARGTGRLRHPGRADPGAPRLRTRQRQGPHPRQHPVGDGRRRTHHHRGAGAGEGHHQRHHLRRRHAVPPVRHRRPVQRLLLPHRLLGPRLQRAVEARLLARPRRCSAAWSTRTPGSPAATTACPTARTRPGRKTRSRACWRCAS